MRPTADPTPSTTTRTAATRTATPATRPAEPAPAAEPMAKRRIPPMAALAEDLDDGFLRPRTDLSYLTRVTPARKEAA